MNQPVTTHRSISTADAGDSPLRICHVIPGTGVGGAQVMLHKLIQRLDPAQFDHRVISLSHCGPMGDAIQSLGIPVEALRAFGEKRLKPWRCIPLVLRLRALRPHVVQTWIYYADLVGGLASKLAGRYPVVWNIRHSTLDAKTEPARIRLTARVCALLSRRLPHRILLNSNSARRNHIRFGYDATKTEVIPNGFDLSRFCPSQEARLRVRQELGLSPFAQLVGLVGRFHPDKDHETFIAAAARVAGSQPDVHFVLCGRGVDWHNDKLAGMISQTGVSERFHLLGLCSDTARLQASFDLAVSSSASEGFANVIGEAMACAVPCIATDVGDSADIVGDTGAVIEAGNERALAAAISNLLDLNRGERQLLGLRARQRIAANFEISQIVSRYCRVWRDVARNAHRGRFAGKDGFERAA